MRSQRRPQSNPKEQSIEYVPRIFASHRIMVSLATDPSPGDRFATTCQGKKEVNVSLPRGGTRGVHATSFRVCMGE